jgi:hypothetical protein
MKRRESETAEIRYLDIFNEEFLGPVLLNPHCRRFVLTNGYCVYMGYGGPIPHIDPSFFLRKNSYEGFFVRIRMTVDFPGFAVSRLRSNRRQKILRIWLELASYDTGYCLLIPSTFHSLPRFYNQSQIHGFRKSFSQRLPVGYSTFNVRPRRVKLVVCRLLAITAALNL